MFNRQMGLILPDNPMIFLAYGTAMHFALPHCYNGTLDRALSAFKEVWDEIGHEGADDKRNLSRAEASLEVFIETHQSSICPYEVVNLGLDSSNLGCDRVSDLEVPFLVDIGGDLPLAGRIDLVVRWKTTGDIWALDFKTSSEVSGRFFKNMHNTPQANAYTLATSQLNPDESSELCQGLIVEAIRTSKTNAENQMYPVWIVEHQLESFMRLANRTAKRILECNESKMWPKSCTGCGNYAMFGQAGYYCPYKDLCDAGDWKTVVDTYRQEEPFHPFIVRR